jgi:hypothetical protein
MGAIIHGEDASGLIGLVHVAQFLWEDLAVLPSRLRRLAYKMVNRSECWFTSD